MIDVSISIDRIDVLTRLIDRIEEREPLLAGMATAVEQEVRDHLNEKYVPRNKRGNFWERVEKSIEVHTNPKAAEVALTETGIRLRYDGGDVYPGKNPARSGPNKGSPTKALAVPSDKVPVRRGRQLAPFQGGLLAYIQAKTAGETVGYLVEGEEKAIGRGPNKGKTHVVPKTGGALMYTLRTVTHHKADKGILPVDSVLLEAMKRAALDHLDLG